MRLVHLRVLYHGKALVIQHWKNYFFPSWGIGVKGKWLIVKACDRCRLLQVINVSPLWLWHNSDKGKIFYHKFYGNVDQTDLQTTKILLCLKMNKNMLFEIVLQNICWLLCRMQTSEHCSIFVPATRQIIICLLTLILQREKWTW